VLDLNKGMLVDPANGNIVDNLIESINQFVGIDVPKIVINNNNNNNKDVQQEVNLNLKTQQGLVEVKPIVEQGNLLNGTNINTLIKRTVDPNLIVDNNEILRQQMEILNGNTTNQRNMAFTLSPI